MVDRTIAPMNIDEMNPAGRPPFCIDPARLREMRKAAGLTQLDLAERIYKKLGKPATSSAVMKTSYQRWERHGAMTPATARYLAEDLRTTVAVLRGAAPDAPANAADQIETRLTEIATGEMPLLDSALRRFEQEENPIRALATNVASRLEVAQLSQDRTELSTLAALTGWTLEELQRPMGVHGYWLLIRTGALGPHKTEILHGVSDLLGEVRQDLERSLAMRESDARVSFYDDSPWFRIEVQHPRFEQLTRTLRFVRAQPTETGLRWTQPDWVDRFWIDELPKDAFEHANFVKGFSGDPAMHVDLSRLRLAIIRNPSLQEIEEDGPGLRPEIIALTKLGPEEPPAHVRAQFEQDGCDHDLITNWLSAELWDHLAPLLRSWPYEYWRLSHAAGRIEVSLDAPLHEILKREAVPRSGPIYSIVLVEEGSGGELISAPWRRPSVAAAQKRLQSFLNQACDEVGMGPSRTLTTP